MRLNEGRLKEGHQAGVVHEYFETIQLLVRRDVDLGPNREIVARGLTAPRLEEPDSEAMRSDVDWQPVVGDFLPVGIERNNFQKVGSG